MLVRLLRLGRNERGLDGFDPDAQIDGLDYALRHPGHARSEYVWNVLLAPNRRLVAGVVERSVLTSFSDSTVAEARSVMGEAAAREAWLPGRDGAFHRPGGLSLDDLPPTYTRDEGLAQALGMLRPAVSEAARQLGRPLGGLGLGDLSELSDPVLRRRARHVVTECARVRQVCRLLERPAEVLWGLSERPDLVALIERELANRAAE